MHLVQVLAHRLSPAACSATSYLCAWCEQAAAPTPEPSGYFGDGTSSYAPGASTGNPPDPTSPFGGTTATTTTTATGVSDQPDPYQTRLDEIESGYRSAISELELQVETLGNTNDNWAAANQFMQDQMLAANAARDLAEQRASNLRNAFVPNANPTALSVLYGDNRRGGRKQEDNQLSDLSILSGLGTKSNPLAGLQLA